MHDNADSVKSPSDPWCVMPDVSATQREAIYSLPEHGRAVRDLMHARDVGTYEEANAIVEGAVNTLMDAVLVLVEAWLAEAVQAERERLLRWLEVWANKQVEFGWDGDASEVRRAVVYLRAELAGMRVGYQEQQR